jgi:hypothetical protein
MDATNGMNIPPEYNEVVGTLAAMSPTKQFGAATVRVYAAALREVPIQELREVVWEIVKTSTFPPTVAEILQRVAQKRLSLPEPFAAWQMVCETIAAREGWNELPEAVRQAADAVGGPWGIRHTDNEIALRAHFLQAYREFSATVERETVLSLGQTRRREIKS